MSDSSKNSGSRTIQCVIVTPEAVVLDTAARSVQLPLYDGLRGVAYGHAPFIGRLGAGEVRIAGGGGAAEASYFVEGGFVEAGQDKVTVITDRAVAASAIDPQQAKEELERIEGSPAVGNEAINERLHAAQAARSMLRIARRRG